MSQATDSRTSVDDGAPLDAQTVPEAFQRTVARFGDKVAIQTVDGSIRYTWSEFDGRMRCVAAGLAAYGIGHGDTVASILPNTVECHLIDFAVMHLGAIPFAIFNSSSPEQIEHQLRRSDTTVVITQQSFLPKTIEAVNALGGQIKHLVVVDGEVPEGVSAAVSTLDQLEAAGDPGFDVDAAWRAITHDDLSALIFTSGTTGPPKAAQWSHLTVMAQQRALAAALPMPHEGVISFMPMAHAGGRITAHYMVLAHGATLTVCPDLRELLTVLPTVHPDAFFSVPRFWEKIQVAIEAMIEAAPDDQRPALQRAVEVGLARTTAAEVGSGVAPEELAALETDYQQGLELLKPILARLGLDRVKSAFVGGAPSAPELSKFFRSVGVPMLEAYGSTEASLNIFNRVETFKSGTAGLPLPGVEIRLAPDGELLARADMNFVNFRHQAEATAEAVDADGWLHTGDIAVVDDDGFVSIVDRKKELIINSAGKNMSPVTIESAVKGESSLIGPMVAIGDRRRFVTALITLDPEALGTYGKRLGLTDRSLDELIDAPEIRAEVASAVDRANARLNNNEQIKKFTILRAVWMPDSDELTPTGKVKRRPVSEKYSDDIEALYS